MLSIQKGRGYSAQKNIFKRYHYSPDARQDLPSVDRAVEGRIELVWFS